MEKFKVMDEVVFDQISTQALENAENKLKSLGFSSSIPGIFWLPVSSEFLSKTQVEHAKECGPYMLAVEIVDNKLVLETLVRASNRMHCNCMELASPALLDHMTDYLNSLLTAVN